MSKKRRVFDIDFDPALTDVPAGPPETRRGPRAAAITENAEAVSARQDAEAAIRAENDALAHEFVRLKKAGLITDRIPVDAVRMDKLTRDRTEGRDAEIDELKRSIREIGLSNPIRVERAGDTYELVQGYRRLTAFRELLAETGDADFAQIPAGIMADGADRLRLYRQMVDENLVRRGVSFGEMAQLAISYRNEAPEVESYDQAVEQLYASSGRQKRHYIKGFARLLIALEGSLKHVEALPRAQGLAVLKRIEDREGQADRLVAMLAARPDRDAEAEQAVLATFLSQPLETVASKKPAAASQAKTTFRLTRPEGVAKCTVADGRVELRLDRDFSGVERRKLERAVTAFLAALDG